MSRTNNLGHLLVGLGIRLKKFWMLCYDMERTPNIRLLAFTTSVYLCILQPF